MDRYLEFQAMVSYLSILFSTLLLFLSVSANAQRYRNVSLSTSISAGRQNSSWVSPSGDFAVGFRPLDGSPNLFLVAVWFDKIPNKTVVWSANGGNPVQSGSKFELASTGRLQLSDHQGRQVWRRDPANGLAEYAAILDTGNFVLVNSGSDYAWESFAEPTDTLLPTQLFGRGSELTSRRAEANFSTGRFKLKLQTDGRLALLPSYQGQTYDGLWYTDTADSGLRLVLTRSGLFYLLLINGSRFNFSSFPSDDVYQRATLGFDGVFRQFVHPKASTNNKDLPWSWTTVSSHPHDICMSNWQKTDNASGVCGFNSYCRTDNNQSPNCLCPAGYSYLDPDDSFSGCKQDFVSQSCVSDGPNKGLLSDFEMEEMLNVDWPLSDYEYNASVDMALCREACLSDCRCAVAISRNGACWKKKLPLSNGRMNADIGGKALVKVAKIKSTSVLPPASGSQGKTVEIIGWVLMGGSGALFLLSATLLCVFLFVRKKQENLSVRKKPESLSPKSEPCGANLMNFTYRELEEMTTGFSEVLGEGASATVYKGVLSTSSSPKFVAVKKLDKLPKEKDQEFNNELKSIAKVHHKNLVPLLGFCNEGPHRLLVYEYMSNGSLANFLFGDSKPSWNQRIRIAFGIGRGLLYLHEECQNQIIHCDIKPQNVLLDDIFMARISDFGLAKLLNASQTRTTTNIRGTRGYVAPEWFKSTPVTAKVDVYSFGVLLLEIICCRRNVEHEIECEEAAILTYWAFDCYKEGRLDALVEDDREALNDAKRFERLLMVAMWCIQEEPSLRPKMRKVTQMLEGSADVPLPPNDTDVVRFC